MKHTLKCRFYLRYVDDFILVSPDQGQLEQWRRQIEVFLTDRLALEIKEDARLNRVSSGADFLGYIVRPDYLLARRRVVGNLKFRLAAYAGRIVETLQMCGRTVTRVNVAYEAVSELRQTLASYLGHLRHASTHNLVQSIFAHFSWLNLLYFLDGYRLHDRFRHQGVFRTFRSQVRFFHCRLTGFVTLFRVGRFFELYGPVARELAGLCGLRLLPEKRGVKQCAGFPVRRLDAILAKILAMGKNAAIVEQGEAGPFVQDRLVSRMYLGAVKK